MIMKTMKDMFDAVNGLPVNFCGVYKHDGKELIHVYMTGTQFNVHDDDGNPVWNVILGDDSVRFVPVIKGVSQWDWSKELPLDEEWEFVPEAVEDALRIAGLV